MSSLGKVPLPEVSTGEWGATPLPCCCLRAEFNLLVWVFWGLLCPEGKLCLIRDGEAIKEPGHRAVGSNPTSSLRVIQHVARPLGALRQDSSFCCQGGGPQIKGGERVSQRAVLGAEKSVQKSFCQNSIERRLLWMREEVNAALKKAAGELVSRPRSTARACPLSFVILSPAVVGTAAARASHVRGRCSAWKRT